MTTITPDPGEYGEQNQAVTDYVAELRAWKRKLTVADAKNLHNLVRSYPTVSPDLGVGIIASQMDWEDQSFSEILRRDAAQADNAFLRVARAGVRGAFTGVESLWQETIARPLRIGVRMHQGEGFTDAYYRSGSSELGRIVREASKGNPIQIGSGWLNQSSKPQDLPGFQEKIGEELKQGNDLATSFATADAWSTEKYGRPITRDYTEVAESTLMHRTQNGITSSSPVSLGTIAAISVAQPNTIPFQLISGPIDFYTRITIDPIEMPIRELALAHSARKTVVPLGGSDTVRRIERGYLQNELDIQVYKSGRTYAPDDYIISGETFPTTSSMDSDAAKIILGQDEIAAVGRHIDMDPAKPITELSYGPGYRQARQDLDILSQELYGMNYNEYLINTYGDAATGKFDEVLSHELTHAQDHWNLTDERWTADDVGRQESIWDEDVGRRKADFDRTDDFDQSTLNRIKEEQKRLDMLNKQPLDKASRADKRTHYKDSQASKEFVDDIHLQMEYDATIKAGKRLLAGESTMAKIRKKALTEAGFRSAWRPWLQPQMIEDWLRTSKARQPIRFLASNTSPAKQRKVLKGNTIPRHVQLQVLEAKTENEVIQAILPVLGVEISQVPKYSKAKILGATMATDWNGSMLGPMTRTTFDGGLIQKTKVGVHRLGAQQATMEINPFDIEKTLDHAEAWLRTGRATDAQVDEVLRMILNISDATNTQNVGVIYNRMVEIYAQQAKLHGMSDEMLERALRDFGSDLMENTEYFIDTMGNKIDEVDQVMEMIYNPILAKDQPRPMFSAVMESQTSQTRWILPNIRTIRRSTSHLHQVTQKRGDAAIRLFGEGGRARAIEKLWPGGLKDSLGYVALDTAHGVWRDLVLLRFGWPVRVISEELVRQAAAGYSDMVTNPLGYLGLMLRHSMNNSAMGDDFASLLTLENVGSGKFRDTRKSWDATKQSWTTVSRGEKGFKEGMANTFLQMYGDELGRYIAEHGPEDALVWLYTGEGRTVARRIEQAGRGNTNLDLSTVKGAKQHINRIYAFQTQYTGGSYIRKNIDGVWVDMTNAPVPDWRSMNRRQIVEEINRRRMIAGEAPVTTKPESYSHGHWVQQISRETNIPILDEIEDGLAYHILQPGREELRPLLSRGVSPIPDGGVARQKWIDEFSELQDRVYAAEKKSDPADWTDAERVAYNSGDYEEFSRLRGYTEEEIADYQKWYAQVEDSNPNMVQNEDGGINVAALYTEKFGEGNVGKPIITPEMPRHSRDSDTWTIGKFTDELETILDDLGVDQVQKVRVPRNALATDAERSKSVVDKMFEMLMAYPSSKLVRSPFFLQRYSEEMAKDYLFADLELRTHLLKWADEQNITARFAKDIDIMAGRVGLRNVPPAGAKGTRSFGMDDLDRLDRVAKSRGLQDTRDLFYDLSERQNITDISKYIFPFADAWYEVLSRWAKLLFTDVERAPTNWRRFQVGVTNLRKSGFFAEDEHGREVFNWPGAGLMAPFVSGVGGDMSMDAKVGIDQMTFITPNPRGLMMPGAGFMVQWPAAMLQPELEKMPMVRDAVNWFAFGDFEQIEPQGLGESALRLLPSWIRQLIKTNVFPEENRKAFADDAGRIYEALLQSENPDYGDKTIDQMKATMKQAVRTNTALSWLMVLDRIFQPATPTYRAEMLIDAMDTGDPMWVTAVSIAEEWTAIRNFYGDDLDTALEVFTAKFGINPLDHTSNTYRIADAPVTKKAYDFLRQNQELYDVASSSMMAWIDVPEDDEFFGIAWQRQKTGDEPQRVNLGLEDRAWIINEQKGWREWNVTTDAVDAWETEIKANTASGSEKRTGQMEVLQDFKNRRAKEIWEEYWAWDNAGKRENKNLPQRTTAANIWDDMRQAGTAGTDAHTVTSKIDPDMSRWMIEFTKLVDLLEKRSLTKSDEAEKGIATKDWWLISTTKEAEILRQAFIDRLTVVATGTPPNTVTRIKYVMDRYIHPRLQGFDWDDELWLVPTPMPEGRVLPSWDDTIPVPHQRNEMER
jgi:hypothetical protein